MGILREKVLLNLEKQNIKKKKKKQCYFKGTYRKLHSSEQNLALLVYRRFGSFK